MKKLNTILAASLLFLARSAFAISSPRDAPRPTPQTTEQHVTVPSQPDEPNKEGTVPAGGEIKTDAAGYPVNSSRPVIPQASGTPAPAQAPPARARSSRTPNSAPLGQTPSRTAAVGAPNPAAGGPSSSFMVKGRIKAYEPGASIRIALVKSGRLLKYSLAPDAVAPGDLRLGEVVNVRIVNRGKARAVDLIERVAPVKR